MSNLEINHVFLTRFNLPSGGIENRIRAKDGWLRDRVVLFERYTLSSMRQQTEKDFAWIIYFDPSSPKWLYEWIERVNSDAIFEPIFRESVNDDELRADLRKVAGVEHSLLLTTNLDNDDGVSQHFAARLRLAASRGGEGRHAIYLTRGLIKSDKYLYLREDRNNAFCSVVESWNRPVSCWSNWHNLLGQTMKVLEIDGDPAWLQVVHGSNVSNRVRGRRVSPEEYQANFPGALDDLPRPTATQLVWDNTFKLAFRSAKELARAGAKWFVMKLLGRDGLDKAKARVFSLAGTRSRRGT